MSAEVAKHVTNVEGPTSDVDTRPAKCGPTQRTGTRHANHMVSEHNPFGVIAEIVGSGDASDAASHLHCVARDRLCGHKRGGDHRQIEPAMKIKQRGGSLTEKVASKRHKGAPICWA